MDNPQDTSIQQRNDAHEEWNAARHDSANSVKQNNTQRSGDKSHDEDSRYTTFSLPTNLSERTDSSISDRSYNGSNPIDIKYAQYTEAPVMYTEEQYEGKTEEEQSHMRMTDYAKEISRMMGHQIVRGLKDNAMRDNAKPESK